MAGSPWINTTKHRTGDMRCPHPKYESDTQTYYNTKTSRVKFNQLFQETIFPLVSYLTGDGLTQKV